MFLSPTQSLWFVCGIISVIQSIYICESVVSFAVQSNEDMLLPDIWYDKVSNFDIITTKQTTWAFKYNLAAKNKFSVGSIVLVTRDYNPEFCKVKYVTWEQSDQNLCISLTAVFKIILI